MKILALFRIVWEIEYDYEVCTYDRNGFEIAHSYHIWWQNVRVLLRGVVLL